MAQHTAPGSFDFHEGDRHDADPGAFVLQFVDITHDGFSEHKVCLGHVDVGHFVILTLREGFIPGLAGFFDAVWLQPV